ncbi:MAG: outer membrane protein assembly factor BamC [Inhella sp.]
MTRFPAPRVLTLSVALALAGCSSFDGMFSGDKVDYRAQSKQTTGLEVPPDLTQLQRQAPLGRGAVSASQLTQSGGLSPEAVAAPTKVAVTQVPGAEIVRMGAVRVIRTTQTPEQVFATARAFWTDLGFEALEERADIGVMETEWKENRAKLPKDFIRRTIGTLLDGLYSTGERDKYRTRVERVGNLTEITITHRGMQEVYTSTQREQTAWQPRPADTEMEAEMLSRLLLRLGGKATIATPEQKATVAAATPNVVEPERLDLGRVPNELVVNEDFERAWRRVGQSLDRHGFTLEDRDRRAGLFFLRYADPDKAGKEEPGFFDRLFGKSEAAAASKLRVSVKSEGNRSVITVQNAQGQQQTDAMAKRILGLLQQDLR